MIQLTLTLKMTEKKTLKMTTVQVVETSVTANKSPIRDYSHLDDRIPLTRDQAFFFSPKENGKKEHLIIG